MLLQLADDYKIPESELLRRWTQKELNRIFLLRMATTKKYEIEREK